jgi:hypothetical protein
MSDLVNRALIVLNDPAGGTAGARERSESTIVVTGVARGGTSMVAQVLDRLGLFLGDDCDPVVVEDVAILRALQNSDMNQLQDIIADRNRHFSLWGFKVPNLHTFLPVTDTSLFRNPRFVVVFRDPLAIARRNELSMFQGALEALREAGEHLAHLISYVGALTAPAMLISYEKVLQYPEHLVDAVAAFCGLQPNDEQKAAALASITPNGHAYMLATRLECLGQIDNIADSTLRGWCCYRGSGDVVEVEVVADGAMIGVYPAGDYREDLLNAGIIPSNHAFNIDLAAAEIHPSTVISVRPAGHELALPNSGRSVAELRAGRQTPGPPSDLTGLA